MLSDSWSRDLAVAMVRDSRGRRARVLWVGTASVALALVVLAHLLVALGAMPSRWSTVSAQRSSDVEPLFVWDQVLSIDDERALSVLLLHADAPQRAPVPPGVDHFPRAGEAYVSPALAAALEADPRLAGRVPGAVVGVLAQDALVSPDQLRAVVGVADPGGLYSGVGWGATDVDTLGLLPVRQSQLVLTLLWGLPALVVLAACAQSHADQVRTHAARLRLVGASTPQVRELIRAYVARACLPAAACGAALGTALVVGLARTGLLGLAFFPTSVPMTVVLAVVAFGGTVAGITAWAALWSRAERSAAYQTVREVGGSRARWAPTAAAAGALLLVGMTAVRWLTADQRMAGGASSLAFLVGSAALVLGTALGVGSCVRRWSGRLQWRRLDVLLAWRQLAHAPTPLVVATFAMTAVATVLAVTFAVLQVLAGTTPGAAGAVWSASVAGSATPDARALVDAVGAGAVLEAVGDDEGVVWGTCTALGVVFGDVQAADGACVDGRTYAPGELVTAPFEEPPSFMGGHVQVRTVDPHTQALSTPAGSDIYVAAPMDDPSGTHSAILRAAPTATLTLLSADSSVLVVVPATERLTSRAALAGGILSLVAVLLAVTLSPAAAASERRLRRLGAGPTTLRRLAGSRAALTMLVAGVAGSVVALLVEQAYLALGSLYVVDGATAAGLVVVVAATTAVAALAGRVPTPRRGAAAIGRGSPDEA
ncbi:hypothetical protein CWIS_15540 [Cellulomonas sp. A375-1]|nr:hypothetical protein CWIS_15540 [Cellulomonas sp. A375-1]